LDESVEVVSHKSLTSLIASERRDSSSERNIDVNCLVSSGVDMGLLVVFGNSVGVNNHSGSISNDVVNSGVDLVAINAHPGRVGGHVDNGGVVDSVNGGGVALEVAVRNIVVSSGSTVGTGKESNSNIRKFVISELGGVDASAVETGVQCVDGGVNSGVTGEVLHLGEGDSAVRVNFNGGGFVYNDALSSSNGSDGSENGKLVHFLNLLMNLNKIIITSLRPTIYTLIIDG